MTTIGFRYDGDGNRLAQIVNGTFTTHTLDVGLVLPEVLVEQGSGGTNLYIHLPNAIATDDGTAWSYSAADGLGSVRQQLDASGQVDSINSYRPFGLPLEGNGGNPYGFTGEWWTSYTKLSFLRSRWYDPDSARFLSPDTIIPDYGFPQSIHKYSYVNNNPVNFADPSGHCDEDPNDPYFDYECWALARAIAEKEGGGYPHFAQWDYNDLALYSAARAGDLESLAQYDAMEKATWSQGCRERGFKDELAEAILGTIYEPVDWYFGGRDAFNDIRKGNYLKAVVAVLLPLPPGSRSGLRWAANAGSNVAGKLGRPVLRVSDCLVARLLGRHVGKVHAFSDDVLEAWVRAGADLNNPHIQDAIERGVRPDKHHRVPTQILNKHLPGDVAGHPLVRGRRGAPNRWTIPRDIHIDIHRGRGGGPYNRRFIDEIDKLGRDPGFGDVLKIRDRIVSEFDLDEFKPR